MYARKTVPTIAASAGSTINLKTTHNEVMDLSITADAADDVTIVQNKVNIITNVAATSTDTITIDVIDSNNNVVGHATSTTAANLVHITATGLFTVGATPSFNGVYTIDWTVNGDVVIAARQTEVYTVRVTFSETVGTDKSLTTGLEESLTWWDEESVDTSIPAVRENITGQATLINDLSGSFEIDNK
jgi:hypothetical protein